MRIEGKEYRTIWFEKNVVKIIDQTKLPHQFIIKDLKTANDAINAIKVHGFVKGSWYAAKRIIKCHPLHPGGDDPVPEKQHSIKQNHEI